MYAHLHTLNVIRTSTYRPAIPHALLSHRSTTPQARTPVIPPGSPTEDTTKNLLPEDKSSKRAEKVLDVLGKLLPSPPFTQNNIGLGNYMRLPRYIAGLGVKILGP